MEPFEVFEQNMREMLLHLYDPVYRPPESLWQALRLPREQGVDVVREMILSSIEEMRPSERVPLSARAWRIYGMLRYRFVEDLPQEMAAERLGITARHLRRDIVEAVHALALHLWEKQAGGWQDPLPASADAPEAVRGPAAGLEIGVQDDSGALWQAQLRRELDSLQETATGMASNLAETIGAALRLGAHLTERRGIALASGEIAPELTAAIHPTALRQILISMIDQLARSMSGGSILLAAEAAAGQVRIHVTAEPAPDATAADFVFVQELVADQGGTFALQTQDSAACLTLEVMAVDRCVLVVDDNADIVHLYRRYLAGTRYYIQHINLGLQVFEAIETHHPAVVVLDVMLPDVDGWDLLTRLHENPATRSLPVVICSVMREPELALALGARQFIAKPVQRGEFIAALEKALAQA